MARPDRRTRGGGLAGCLGSMGTCRSKAKLCGAVFELNLRAMELPLLPLPAREASSATLCSVSALPRLTGTSKQPLEYGACECLPGASTELLDTPLPSLHNMRPRQWHDELRCLEGKRDFAPAACVSRRH